MNLTAQSLKDEFLGRVCLKRDAEPALLNQRIARLVPHSQADLRPYLFIYFKSPYFRSFVNGLDTGSLIRHMHSKDVARHVVPLPPPDEQREIACRVHSMFRLADAIDVRVSAAIVRAESVTQSVLAKAFRGELVPTEAELAHNEGRDYEPASALVERVRASRRTTPHPEERKTTRRARHKRTAQSARVSA
jgi:type I restriction enzyme S subunit